jgi:hypothetical protein
MIIPTIIHDVLVALLRGLRDVGRGIANPAPGT